MENLKNIIISILFVSGDSIDISAIAEGLNIELNEVENAVNEIKLDLEKQKFGIQLLVFNGKVQLCSNKEYVEPVTVVLNPIKEKNLTKAVLEVCGIIAYKQPITRIEVENIRQVNSDYAISTLLENDLIEVVGRKDTVGKPLLFGTTDNFLKKFGLNHITDLPDYDDLLNRIKVLHSENNDSSSLFNLDKLEKELSNNETLKSENNINSESKETEQNIETDKFLDDINEEELIDLINSTKLDSNIIGKDFDDDSDEFDLNFEIKK